MILALVVAESVSRNAPFDEEALAASVERLIADRGALPRLDRPDWSGPGVLLDRSLDIDVQHVFPM